MKRIVAKPIGAPRRLRQARPRVYRMADGCVVPPGMLALSKASRAEREVNRRARARRARALEREVVDELAAFRNSITRTAATEVSTSGNVRVIVNAATANELEASLQAVVAQRLEEGLADGVHIGLRFGGPAIQGVPIGLATEAAVSLIEMQAASAVRGISQTTTSGIREILRLGVTDALSPIDVAERIGDLAGLDPRRVRAVENFRKTFTARLTPVLDPERIRLLPERLRPFVTADSRLVTPQVQRVIDQEVGRFRDRQLLARGQTIADTEIQNAITSGERAFWDEAVRSGQVDGPAVVKTWRTVRDDRVCPICEPLHGQTVPFDAPFATSVGPLQGPSAHPRCRCFLEYGELDPDTGRAISDPDAGARSRQQQEGRRLVDPETVREDLQVARIREDRLASRASRMRPGTKAQANALARLDSNGATIRSLEQRLPL